MCALSTASASGVIVRGGDVLEATADVKLALLDKTGTLTSGRPSLTGVTVTSTEIRGKGNYDCGRTRENVQPPLRAHNHP